MIYNENCLERIKKLKDTSIDIIFGDPPYSLGCKFEIDKETGGYKIKGKPRDFMNAWDSLTPVEWDLFFKEAQRAVKFGGYVILFGMDELGALLNYYAIKNDFEIMQSMAYYSIQGFPKNLDISKAIDKKIGKERELLYTDNTYKGNKNTYHTDKWTQENFKREIEITRSTSKLGQKYEGYKGGIKPLKPSLEFIYVFKKSMKEKAIVDNVLSYENGDDSIHPPIVNIDGCRVKTKDDLYRNVSGFYGDSNCYSNNDKYKKENKKEEVSKARYPNQLFLDKECADLLDEQSGVLETSGTAKLGKPVKRMGTKGNCYSKTNKVEMICPNDSGGCSRVSHICEYEEREIEELIFYSSKVSSHERNAGCDELENKDRFGQGNYSQSPYCNICNKTINGSNNHKECEKNKDYKLYYKQTESNKIQKNNHPTLKPMKLLYLIENLFVIPDKDKQTWFLPFFGAGSEYISLMANDIPEENIIACELSEDYIEIGKVRKEYWKENNYYFKEDKKEQQKIKNKLKKDIIKKKKNKIRKIF